MDRDLVVIEMVINLMVSELLLYETLGTCFKTIWKKVVLPTK